MAGKNDVEKLVKAISDKDKKIEKLEKILAKEIQRASDFLKENESLLKEYEKVREERNSLRRYWRQSQKENRVRCDRDKAMIQYGEVDMAEVLGSK